MNDRKPPRISGPLEITELGAQGDGIAEVAGERVYVPFALPGEKVEVEITERRGEGWSAQLIDTVTVSPLRIAAPCPHFGVCGGCMLQHLDRAAYRDWKRGLVVKAMQQRGIEIPADTRFVETPPNTRRRASFAAKRAGGALLFGFHAPESQEIVPIATCHVLTPSLTAQLPLLRSLADLALGTGQTATVTATETETGLDVLIESPQPLERRRALTDAASKAPIARLSWQQGRGEPEPLAQHAVPKVNFAGISVDLPAGAFLQPSGAGEAALAEAVTGFAAGAKSIADLYAGCGTFTFPLAKVGKVAAFETSKPAVAAVMAATNHSGLSGRVTAQSRNLDSSPVSPEELRPFDCVVFDPPRAGAKSQSEILVRARLKRAVAVSCNPASFARDARILIDGGFRLKDMVIVDQFVWSAHVEIVAAFRR
ncbi:MAG TPA: TRAM domain-containing protein [Dongiaceae bacterium]